MIDKKELRELHSNDLPLHVLEQDYIQALYLQKLYKKTEGLVFKGGTFLKHAHGLDRFSEDLDFTIKRDSDRVVQNLEAAAENLSDYGVEANIDNVNENQNSITCRLRYRGPLYDGSEKSIGSIEIDASKRNDLVLDPVWTRLFFDYPEIRVANVLGLRKTELLAEKLRALTTREKARDLYDCWYLINQNTELDPELFQKKMNSVGRKTEIRISVTENSWKKDLEIFLEKPPEYDLVRDQLVNKLVEEGFQIREP